MFCEQCGGNNPGEGKFCQWCGAPLRQPADIEEPQPHEERSAAGDEKPQSDPGPQPAREEYSERSEQSINEQPVCHGQDDAMASSREQKPKRRLGTKGLIVIIAAAAVVIIAVLIVIIVVILNDSKAVIDVNECVSVSFSGPDGYGKARLSGEYDWVSAAYMELEGDEKYIEAFTLWLSEYGYNYSVVTYTVEPAENLSNGDTVLVTAVIDEDAVSDLPVDLIATPLEITVEGLPEVETVDLFANMEITYSGYAPYATINLNYTNEYIYVEFTCDTQYVDNGDTFTITASYDADALLEMGYMAQSDTMEVTVYGLSSYYESLYDIPDSAMEELKDQAEDVMTAYVANRWSEETRELESLEYLGCYFLTPKESYAGSGLGNMIYLVYEVNASSEYDGDVTYYVTFQFSELVQTYDGGYDLNLDSCTMSTNRIYFGSFWLQYYGYTSLDSLESSCVDAYADRYDCESSGFAVSAEAASADTQEE